MSRAVTGWIRSRRLLVTVVSIGVLFGWSVFAEVGAWGQETAQELDESSSVEQGVEEATEGGEEDDLQAKVDGWFEQLDARSLADRLAAKRELLALGPSILPLLPPQQPGQSREVIESLAEIRKQLELKAAERYRDASRVDLHGTFDLWQALAEIETQTGNGFQRLGVETEALEWELEQVEYWRAIDLLLERYGEFVVHPFRAERGQLILSRSSDEKPSSVAVSYAGPFRISVTGLQVHQELQNDSLDRLTVFARIYWEPRLEPISLSHDLERLVVDTDDGEVHRSSSGASSLESAVVGEQNWIDVNWVVGKPERSAGRIEKISGRFTALVPGERIDFRFSDLALTEPYEQRTGATAVTLERVEKSGDLTAVRVRVQFSDSAGSLESHRRWLFESPAFLRTKADKRLDFFSYETLSRSNEEVGIAYLFGLSQPVEDYEFVYRLPSAILTSTFDWELTDLPLP